MKIYGANRCFTRQNFLWNNLYGFTFIELILVISLFSIIFVFIIPSIVRPRSFADIVSTQELIYSTVKEAQSLAMTNPQKEYGIHFEQDKFILFEGSVYSLSDPNNLETTLTTNLAIESITLPSGDIIFSQLSGEVQNYTSGQDSFVLRENNTNDTKIFTINKIGTLNAN